MKYSQFFLLFLIFWKKILCQVAKIYPPQKKLLKEQVKGLFTNIQGTSKQC